MTRRMNGKAFFGKLVLLLLIGCMLSSSEAYATDMWCVYNSCDNSRCNEANGCQCFTCNESTDSCDNMGWVWCWSCSPQTCAPWGGGTPGCRDCSPSNNCFCGTPCQNLNFGYSSLDTILPVALVNLPDKEQEIDLTSQDPTGNLACAQNRQVAYATSTLRQGWLLNC
jgi:hypothetical protein